MKVLLVGGGGREHALAWRLRRDEPNARIFAAPGNPGIADLATCVPVGATDIEGLRAIALQEEIDWVLVGPEAPLAAGLADSFRAEGIPIFGPSAAAAALETSKAFSKSLMIDVGVPTARAITVNTVAAANRAIEEIGAPVVVKASGLAAGKGVMICHSVEEAKAAARAMLEQAAFGDAGDVVLIEEFMQGEELSVFVLTDGTRMIALPSAQDHKRLLDGDAGPNTGGMGAYCPVSLATNELIDDVLDDIVAPTLEAMRDRGTPFSGLLYAGLMLTADGPRVVEFNCRFGDPETEAVLPALSDDVPITALMETIARGGELPSVKLTATRAAATTVVAASGYPDKPRGGDRILVPALPDDVIAFHAGTTRDASGTLVTSGGRVLAITGLGDTLEEAVRRSQAFAGMIDFAGKQLRTDIGWREMGRSAGAT